MAVFVGVGEDVVVVDLARLELLGLPGVRLARGVVERLTRLDVAQN